jgi:hypothetical protein
MELFQNWILPNDLFANLYQFEHGRIDAMDLLNIHPSLREGCYEGQNQTEPQPKLQGSLLSLCIARTCPIISARRCQYAVSRASCFWPAFVME